MAALFALPGAGAAAAETPWPSGWAARGIGGATPTGSARFVDGTFTVKAGGANIWGAADQFVYAYRQMTGDGTLIARLASLGNVDPFAKAGVMIRESLSAGARNAFVLATPANGLAFQRRQTTGGATLRTMAGTGAAPVWLKIERRGSTFTAFRSADGITWTRIGSDTIAMAASVYVGLAVTSKNPSALVTAAFGHVHYGGGMPAKWSSADIGRPMLGGAALHNDGTFKVKGAGRGIGGASDQFTFAYRQVTGDVDVVARVSRLQQAHDWSRAGVMVRASLRPDARHASFLLSAANGLTFQRRPATALSTLQASGGTGTAPVWLKLERRGSAITAFRSADGRTWKMIGSETLSLPTTFYVGLAATSNTVSSWAMGTFDRVSITSAWATSTAVTTSSTLATAVFKPSTDHATRVTSYLLEIFKAGANPSSATPVRKQDLGKPAVLNGECKASIATTIAALPSGDYFATIAARGSGGTSARALSAVFRR